VSGLININGTSGEILRNFLISRSEKTARPLIAPPPTPTPLPSSEARNAGVSTKATLLISRF